MNKWQSQVRELVIKLVITYISQCFPKTNVPDISRHGIFLFFTEEFRLSSSEYAEYIDDKKTISVKNCLKFDCPFVFINNTPKYDFRFFSLWSIPSLDISKSMWILFCVFCVKRHQMVKIIQFSLLKLYHYTSHMHTMMKKAKVLKAKFASENNDRENSWEMWECTHKKKNSQN